MEEIYSVYFYNIRRGMFSIVNDLIDHLYVADKKKYKLKARWIGSPYKKGTNLDDCFQLYFKDFFKISSTDVVKEELTSFAYREGNCITPRDKIGLALPKEREVISKIIHKYLILKPQIQDKINEFYNKYFKGHIIGLHIRGRGHVEAIPFLRNKGIMNDQVPYDLYFKKIDELLSDSNNSKIFLCSDSQDVIDKCNEIYKEKIIIYKSTRCPDGEMHWKHKEFWNEKYKLGEDIIIEAYLLSMTDYLVHGMSNVTNFVLCKNDKLLNYYIY